MMQPRNEYNKDYHLINRAKISARKRAYYLLTKEIRLAYRKDYYKKNKEQLNQKNRSYKRTRYKTDINYKILRCLRSRLTCALAGSTKKSTTKNLLGCTIDDLKLHLESKFVEGMTWENYGEWHIDHVVPCCKFEMSLESEQKLCFHFTNLQPLWAKDNLIKGSK